MEEAPATGRLYKSRKSRPCDCCRRRKVTCDMPTGPPCHRCSSRGFSCTFNQGPGVRKRATKSPQLAKSWDGLQNCFPFSPMFTAEPGQISSDQVRDILLQDLVLPEVQPDHGFTEPEASPHTFQHGHQSSNHSPSATSDLSIGLNPRGEGASRSSIWSNISPMKGSLEVIPGAFSFFIGPTGAADVQLLNRESYDINDIARPRLTGLKYRRVNQQAPDGSICYDQPAIFGITDLQLLENAEPRVESSTMEDKWAELWKIIKPQTAWRLIKLYGRFIDPCFPIISAYQLPSTPDELSNMPLSLLAALCASALPFVMYDESLYSLLLHPPSSQQLYRLCWLDVSQQFHNPSLATLQACLLLQQRLPTNAYLSDTAFSWTLMSSAIAVAQTIGLHCDPSDWETVPLWERKLRKRLWWAMWIMEKWVALTRGMPSHIHPDDFDVPNLIQDDICDTLSSSAHTKTHLCHLARITRILADIQNTYFSVRGIRVTSHDLQLSLDLARSSRAQLKEWRDSLPSDYQFPSDRASDPNRHHHNLDLSNTENDDRGMDGSGSIHLSYIITHMTLFRALLRPLNRWYEMMLQSPENAEALYTSAKAVIRGSIFCVQNFVEFLENLTAPQWNAFWHSWARTNFAIGGSFMVNLLHITSDSIGSESIDSTHGTNFGFEEEDRELREWIKRWRIAIRVSANGAAGARGLANLGLLRVEMMLTKLLSVEGSGEP